MPRKNPEEKKEYNRKWREANPEALKEYYQTNKDKFREHNKNNRKKQREFVQDLKKGKCCSRCGWNEHPCALDFHHIDASTKYKDIAMMTQTHSIKKLQEEIDKCILVCANCHRILHHEQRNTTNTETGSH